MPSKQQLLLRLAKRENHSWDHLLGVWNAIYDFFKPILEREILDLEENGTWTRLGKMRNKPNFPEEQVLAAKLSKKQVQSMIGSVILHITNKELEDRFETLSLSTNREEDGDALNDTFQIASAHQPAELGISTTVLPKQQCFSRLAESQDRKWDDLLNAWDAVYEFIEPRLQRRVSKLPSEERLQKWRCKYYYLGNKWWLSISRLMKSIF